MRTITISDMRRLIPFFSCLIIAVFSCGCLGPIAPSFYTDSVRIQVDYDANNDSATAVDMVVVYDEALLKELLTMTSEKYFANARQLRRDFPGKLETFHWEVVPGQTIQHDNLKFKKSSPYGAVVFARYISPGDHRQSIGSQEFLAIHLMKDGFEISALDSYDSGTAHYKESE